MAPSPSIAPFAYRAGRLFLEDVDLVDLGGTLDGRAAWLISHAAVDEAIAAATAMSAPGGSPRVCCLDVAAVGPPVVLAQCAGAGWWARVRSSHELTLALAAGFPPERLVAGGGVRDDGFVKDALATGVAMMEHDGAAERNNAERIGALLGQDVPSGSGAPPDAPSDWLAHCGGLFAPVLRPPPALAIDAVCPCLQGAVHVMAIHASDSIPGTVCGLGTGGRSLAGQIPARVIRGDWVVLAGAAAEVKAVDPAHAEPLTVLVRGSAWRVVGARPMPLAPA